MTVLLPFRRYLLGAAWCRNLLWKNARAVPALDLDFAGTKSLNDGISSRNLITFTRASTGTYVGSDGLLKTAVTNLVLRSEELNDASWTKTTSTVSSNVIAAPNGTTTADKFIEGSGSVTPTLAQAISVTSGISYTFTVYAKEDLTSAKRYLTLLLPSTQFGSNVRVTFNLANGTSVSTNSPDATSVISIGDGWYRCSVTKTATLSGSAGVQLRLFNATPDTLVAYTGDGTSGIYLWGAQFEQSSTVGDYVPTTSTINSAPRFDHNPTTGESLGLLVEEARTNYLLQSQDFTTTWSQTGLTVTPNTTSSPDGSANADTLLTTVTGSALGQTALSLTAGSTITASIFAKKITSNFIRFELGNLCSCWFNLNTGVTASNNAGSGNVLFSAKSIQPFGNGWYRCVLTVTTSVITTLSVNIFATNTDGNTSSIGSSVFVWGAQLEAGAFPTSYIPTVAATVTRAADVASITGSNFSSFYNQTEGTVFGQFLRTASTNTQQGRVFSFNDGTNTNAFEIYQTGASNPAAQITATTGQALWTPSGFTVGTSIKEVLGYKLNNSNASFNGSVETLDTVCNIPTVTQARIGDRQDGVRTLNGTIQRLTYWPTRLANTVLQQITL